MAIREGLLALLDEGPRHGYQLKTDFESATGGVWPLNVGQVYTTLDRVERDGLVQVDDVHSNGGGPQRTYRLTPAGREELGSWWSATPPTDDPPPRDELVLKVLMAIGASPAHGLAVITRQRTALAGLLQRARRASRDKTPNPDLAAALVADSAVVRAEADLRWLDLCEARLAAHHSSTEDPR